MDLEDDATYVNMGGAWRMPTKDELEELLNNTTHEVVIINRVQCMMFTSNINGNQLFIPFMKGCWYNEEWQDWDMSYMSYIYMWSSQTNNSNINNAYRLYCVSDGYADVINSRRASALSVRGVFKK